VVEDRLARLESRVIQLERTVRDLEVQLEAAAARRDAARGLSAGSADRAPIPGDAGVPMPAGDGALMAGGFRLQAEDVQDRPPVVDDGEASVSRDIAGPLGLAGRTFMIFAGAYLLRALVDSGSLPIGLGVAAGVAYAIVWLGWSARVATRSAPSALVYGGAAVAIGYPLVWEATTRFRLLDPGASASVLALVTALALGVAWRRTLHLLAWAATLASLGVSALLLVQTGEVAAYAVFLVALGIATLWLGYDRDWYGLRWPAALAADLAVLGVTSRALSGPDFERPAVALTLQCLLLGGYLVTIAARTLVRGRNVVPFEVAQTAAALAVSLSGAVAVARHTGAGGLALGSVALGIGGACYAVAFAFIDRRQGLGRNFYFYTSLGLVLTLTGAAVLMRDTPLVVTWSAAAVVAAWCGWRFSRAALTLHAAVYLGAAAATGGLLLSAEMAFFGSAGAPWLAMGTGAWVVLAATVMCTLIPRDPRDLNAFWRMPRVVMGLLLVAGLGTAVLAVVVPRLAGTPGVACDAGILATVRTAVVAIAAVALALCRQSSRGFELAWLLYPVLIAGGLKLLVEDLRYSRASTLFVALALYGGALIVAPRLARTVTPRTEEAPTSAPAQRV
jgi:Predicted membrane protein (DUF2339)